MVDLEPKVGIGPLKLGMTQADAEKVLGKPQTVEDPSDDDFLDDEDLKFYRNQLIATYKKTGIAGTVELTFEKNRVVAITLYGDLSGVSVHGLAADGDRMKLLEAALAKSPTAYIRSENYWFADTGICLSRAKNRKDINYVRLYDITFKAKRLAFELYKPHAGPIVA